MSMKKITKTKTKTTEIGIKMHKIYPFSRDKKLKVLEFDINQMAAFSNSGVVTQQMSACLCQADGQWLSTPPNRFFKTVPSRTASKDAIERFQFPEDIRYTANKFSKDFVSLLTKDVRCGVIRNQLEGRWDTRKTPKLYTQFRNNKFDINEIRPFEKREKILKSTPTVGIVADGSYGRMWGDEKYIPNIMTLIIGTSFACQAAGFNTTASITVGQTNTNGFHLVAHPVVEDNRTIDLNKYGVYFHVDTYRGALHNAALFNKEIFEANSNRWVFYGSNGGKAVEYIRNKGAEIVVSIGAIEDAKDADIVVTDTPALEDALKQISTQLKTIYDKKAA